MNSDERPSWARRLRSEREARGWSVRQAVRAMVMSSEKPLVEEDSLVRYWRRWEAGEVMPDEFHQPIIAKIFDTVTHAFFPAPTRRDGNSEIVVVSGMETLDIVTRLQRSDVNNATLEALRITVDRLCSEYPHMPSAQLLQEGRQWLRQITTTISSGRPTLSQHRELMVLGGWLALLVGCVENDMGERRTAEATRRAALSIGNEAGAAEISGWAHEMLAWFRLTDGDQRGVIAAAKGGLELAPHAGVAVQLYAQQAKAYARVGDRRAVEVALDAGRRQLEGMDYPENLDHHFVVDPAKFDYYSMDCYRILGEDKRAETLAGEVIRVGTNYLGEELNPMRLAEARLTLGVVAARAGDLEEAVNYGELALTGERKSLPSLLMISKELAVLVNKSFAKAPEARAYIDRLTTLSGELTSGG
jgi:transcriptional regulator with XRE-family HTH domain